MTPFVDRRRSFNSVKAVRFVLPLLALLGCGKREELLGVLPAVVQDSGPDAQVRDRPHFATAELVDRLNVPGADDEAPTLTADLLEIYFMSARSGARHLWTSTRASRTEPWQPPRAVSELNTDSFEITPSVSLDGLRLWFCVGSTPTRVWLSTRASRSDSWNAALLLTDLLPPPGTAQVNSPALDESETMIAVALRGTATESWDLYAATRASSDANWGAFAALTGVGSAVNEYDPSLIDGGRELFFSSARSGMDDLFWSFRASNLEAFQAPVALDELNTPDFKDYDPFIAPDRSVLFFASNRLGFSDIYQAAASP
jgi:WD40-like Beta Propeller Repeat